MRGESLITIHHGHVLEQLAQMKAESVHACITSPPYWALRDYKLPEVTWPDGWVGQLGLEPTPDMYAVHIVSVFRAVRRVLRHDGVVWIVINDCYVKGKPREVEESAPGGTAWGNRQSYRRDRRAREDNPKQSVPGLKPKDLVGIPWRVAFALQADGWYLRSDNIWNKSNVLPETVRDRCTRAHEYVFMLTKSEHYFWDRFAVRELASRNTHSRGRGVNPKSSTSEGRVKQNASWSAAVKDVVSHRNKRSVWTFPTQAYRGKHYATFPEKLVEPMILSSTSAEGCCAMCGAPQRRRLKRIDDRGPERPDKLKVKDSKWIEKGNRDLSSRMAMSMKKARAAGGRHDSPFPEYETSGWRRTCDCGLGGHTRAVVLDPFGGTGTVGRVAERLGRDSALVELSDSYVTIMRTEMPDAQ